MKDLYIVANWKSYKTELEAKKWFQEFPISGKEIIICPSFTLLPVIKSYVISHKFPIKLGAQNISPFDEGAYTGEVSGRQIKEFAEYVIVGHSERRKNFGETDDLIFQKLVQALKFDLIPIVCVSNNQQIQNLKFKMQNYNSKSKIEENKIIVAYEPLFAIGSGNPDTPDNADKMASEVKRILGDIPVLYGGSVTSSNVNSFTSMTNISGVLVGGASLDSLEFSEIVKNA